MTTVYSIFLVLEGYSCAFAIDLYSNNLFFFLFRLRFIVKYLSPATSTVIIRCPRAAYRLVWAALTYINSIPASSSSSATTVTTSRNAVFRVVRVSGTMRKAEEEAIRRARREIARTKRGQYNGLEGLFGRGDKDDVVAAVGGREEEEAVFGMDVDDGDDIEDDDED